MILSFAQSVCTLTKAFVHLLSLTSKRLLWSSWYAEKLKHTCLKYFAKKKIGPKIISKSYNHDREVHVCGYVVDGMGKIKYSMYDLSLLIIFGHS